MNGHQRKEALLLFGGIASGKTTLAETLEDQGAKVYSTDRLIHERTLQARMLESGEQLPILNREERDRNLVKNLCRVNVFDFMVNQHVINVIARTGALITAIHLNISRAERLKRFQQRKEHQERIIERIISILRIQIPEETRVIQLHSSLKERGLYEAVPNKIRAEFNNLVHTFYRSGSHSFDERSPDPADYSKINHVITYNDCSDLKSVAINGILKKSTPLFHAA